MKVAFFALPLLAAFASARAVNSISERNQDCVNRLSDCLQTAAASGGSIDHAQCKGVEEQCASFVLPRAAALDPRAPDAQVLRIAQAIDGAAGGKNSGIDSKGLAAKIHKDVTANGINIGAIIQMIIDALHGKHVDIGKIIGAIFEVLRQIFGNHAHSLSVTEGSVKPGDVANVVLASLHTEGKPPADIGKIIEAILGFFKGGKLDIAGLIQLIIDLLKGKFPNAKIGQTVHGVMQLSASSGALAARSEDVHAASLFDIPKLIAAIIQIVGDGKHINVGKLIQAIVALLAEIAGGIMKIIFPGFGGLSARDGVVATAAQINDAKSAFGDLINGILQLFAEGKFSIGKLIGLIMKFLASLPKLPKPGHH
ncbi:hypothetical protein MferCBS31731_004059 [Microsporum ferrugineum]